MRNLEHFTKPEDCIAYVQEGAVHHFNLDK